MELLFERCLIACALYEEFWMKYFTWTFEERKSLDKSERVEKARDVLNRACTHHLPAKVDIHLHYAAFEETLGDFEKSANVLKSIEEKHPEMLSLMLRRINLERRRGNVSQVHQLYQDCISKAGSKSLKSDLWVKYARFLRLQLDDSEGAVKALEGALEKDPDNAKLHLQLLDITLHEKPLNVTKVCQLLDRGLEQVDAPRHKLLFSQRKLDFLEDFGCDINHLSSVQKEHEKLAAEVRLQLNSEKENNNGQCEAAKESEKKPATSNGSSATTTYPPTNSASYNAHHTNQYQQYGARLSGNAPPPPSSYANYYNQ